MKRILQRAVGIRYSRRYPGYLRVYNRHYLLALLDFVLLEGTDLIELLNLNDLMGDLRNRLEHPEQFSVAEKLTRGIVELAGAKSPMHLAAEEFNLAAEQYYRTVLRRQHLIEGLTILRDDLRSLSLSSDACGEDYNQALTYATDGRDAREFLERAWDDLIEEKAPPETLKRLVHLSLVSIHHDGVEASRTLGGSNSNGRNATPICGEGNG